MAHQHSTASKRGSGMRQPPPHGTAAAQHPQHGEGSSDTESCGCSPRAVPPPHSAPLLLMPSKIEKPGTPLPPFPPPLPSAALNSFWEEKLSDGSLTWKAQSRRASAALLETDAVGWGKAAQHRTITDPHTFTASEVQLRGSPAGSGCTREAAAASGGELPPGRHTVCPGDTWGCAACPAPAHSPAPLPSPPSPPCPKAHSRSCCSTRQTEPPRVSAVCWHGPAGTAGLPCPKVPTGDVKSHWEPTRAPGVTETQNGPAWDGPQGS